MTHSEAKGHSTFMYIVKCQSKKNGGKTVSEIECH